MNLLAFSIPASYSAADVVLIMGCFFGGLFGGLGYLLKIWKGNTDAQFDASNLMAMHQQNVAEIQAVKATADDAHARLDLAAVPSVNTAVEPVKATLLGK